MSEINYRVNEVFYSLQGEGLRAGSANVFVRFSGCNLRCSLETAGFDCDSEFTSGTTMTGDELLARCIELLPPKTRVGSVGVVFTGGEPALQLDSELLHAFKERGFFPLCVETNGTKELPDGLDWISCSPKTAEHTLRIKRADELRYVRRIGMAVPQPSVPATHHFLSPAFSTDGISADDLVWCIQLVKENPTWRLSVQQHKIFKIR